MLGRGQPVDGTPIAIVGEVFAGFDIHTSYSAGPEGGEVT